MTSFPSFNMIDVIRKKRDGHSLSSEEIQGFITAYTNHKIPDYQASALLMAIFLQGLSNSELLSLTEAMLHSGRLIDLSSLHGPKVGKHSTGGVGDKTSISLAPAVAACGVYVPKMSGRGLGHTGGTLDKLESIPGFQTRLLVHEFIKVLQEVGVALIGQTEELAPADKMLYALRDVTGTVESIPLIAASIMSKKLAEGLDGLVLDVKVGSGALMKTLPESRALAHALISLGHGAGKRVSALITNMDQPLGRFVGNAAEINESVEVLRGKGEPDLREITCALGGEMLRLGGVTKNLADGKSRIAEVLDNGEALKKFADMARLQGSTIDLDSEEEPWFKTNLHTKTHQIVATQDGYVQSIDTRTIGLAGVSLGMGRMTKDDLIDPAAFIYLDKKCGEFIKAGQPLCHFATSPRLPEMRFLEAQTYLQTAYTLDNTVPVSSPLIFEILS